MSKKILKLVSTAVFCALAAGLSCNVMAEDMQAIVPSASGLSLSPSNALNVVPPATLPAPYISEQPSAENHGGLPHYLGVLTPNDLLPQPRIPTEQTSELSGANHSDVPYVTGGIGDEDLAALKATEKEYNLRIISSEKSGGYTGTTHIVIIDTKSKQILSIDAEPLLFLKVPRGQYTITAINEGKFKKQSIVVYPNKSAIVHLIW